MMDYEEAVARTWRHSDLRDGHDYRNLVRYATLAASSHNTQPWKFKLEHRRISIFPDLTRRCPAVDPDDHHLYASLGCAAENLLLAAQAAGWRGHFSYDAVTSSVHVDLDEAGRMTSPLFDAIPVRQCTRAEYDGSDLIVQHLEMLREAGRGNGVSVVLLTGAREKEEVAQYVAEGNSVQFRDSRWAEELRSWIRFNGHDAVRTGDGLYGAVMGNPDVPGGLGRLFMRMASSSRRQSRKDIAHIRSSSAVAVFVSHIDDASHWVTAGRCYQRMALQAAALDLRTAFINQPVEVTELRRQFAAYLGVGGGRPDLVVRIGRGPEMPRSLRRQVEDVLM